MADSLETNPFAGLFPSTAAARQFSEQQRKIIVEQAAEEQETNSESSIICIHSKQNSPSSTQSELDSELSTVSLLPSEGNSTSDVIVMATEEEDVKVSLLEWLLLCCGGSNGATNTEHPCVLLPDTQLLTVDTVSCALFERLMLDQQLSVVGCDEGTEEQHSQRRSSRKFLRWLDYKYDLKKALLEAKALEYLLQVYKRCNDARKVIRESKTDINYLIDIIKIVEKEVVNNFHTAVLEPELYSMQSIETQLMDLLREYLPDCDVFVSLIKAYAVQAEREKNTVSDVFERFLVEVSLQLKKCNLFTVNWQAVELVQFYTQVPSLATIMLRLPAGSMSRSSNNNRVTAGPRGSWYQTTALGRLLSISCLSGHLLTYFPNTASLSNTELAAINARIEQTQEYLLNRLDRCFYAMLENAAVKPLLLSWIENCLASNLGRTGLWHITGEANVSGSQFVCDGFMVNLGSVLARFASKFTEDINTSEPPHLVMKVDPSFCFGPVNERFEGSIPGSYPAGLYSLTTLIPQPTTTAGTATQPPPLPVKYTFITSCFFFANCALHLGLNVVDQRLGKVQTELSRLHRLIKNFEGDSLEGKALKARISFFTSTYLTLRAALLPQASSAPIGCLLAATAHWLVQICEVAADSPWDAVPHPSQPVVLPVPECSTEDRVPASVSWLRFVPEFMVENIANLSMMARMLNTDDPTPLFNIPLNRHFLTFIIAFMGSASRVKNPHHRADLARTLELLLLGEPLSSSTDVEKTSSFGSVLPGIWEELVVRHPLADHLVTAVVRVFVSIEMTGQNVDFEEKFKYRIPMYEIMKQLWQMESQRCVFSALADEALANMESPKPPLFLRFVNLLINDNIFLLDEGLSYMKQIKEIQEEKARGDWASLSSAAQMEKESMLHHTAMLARFHNVLARRTCSTLAMLTQEMSAMFCHSTLVDRVAAMLNYFLDHLVGPKQLNFKVRASDSYEFQPGAVVTLICRVYRNLHSHASFCAAVLADGRSYSPQLLGQACSVLGRIGEHEVAESLSLVQASVTAAAQSRQDEDDLTAAAPEHFLDPIMSVLMRDPVTLPTSGTIVDRTTIARHLLSDQSDPFNRQPLTMDKLQPATELRREIGEWLSSRQTAWQLTGAGDSKQVQPGGGDCGKQDQAEPVEMKGVMAPPHDQHQQVQEEAPNNEHLPATGDAVETCQEIDTVNQDNGPNAMEER